MKTKIILIDVAYLDARKLCEAIENMAFNNEQELKEKLKEMVRDSYVVLIPHFGIMELTDFMDDFNNEEKYLNNYFISYINFKTD